MPSMGVIVLVAAVVLLIWVLADEHQRDEAAERSRRRFLD